MADPDEPIVYRGYVLTASGRFWLPRHIETGDAPVDVLPDGTTALLAWRGRLRLQRAIDATYRAPGDES